MAEGDKASRGDVVRHLARMPPESLPGEWGRDSGMAIREETLGQALERLER